MRIRNSIVAIVLLFPSWTNGQDAPGWRFGAEPSIEPIVRRWSEISVVRRPVPLAQSRSERLVFEPAGALLPDKVRLVRETGSVLLDEPGLLADLREGAGWDPVLDRYGFWDAMEFEIGGGELAAPAAGDETAQMFCTVYYTPMEEGFTPERGFDVTPETKPGLGGRKYGRDFLAAVRVEGFGRLKTPVGDKAYIKFDGRWGFQTRILGNRNNTLVDRRSVAVHRRNPVFTKGSRVTIMEPTVFEALGVAEWRVADTGGGLHHWQLDLYWGEDIPMGTGMDRFRPLGCPLAVKFWFPVVVSRP